MYGDKISKDVGIERIMRNLDKSQSNMESFVIKEKLRPWAESTFGITGVAEAIRYGKMLCDMEMAQTQEEMRMSTGYPLGTRFGIPCTFHSDGRTLLRNNIPYYVLSTIGARDHRITSPLVKESLDRVDAVSEIYELAKKYGDIAYLYALPRGRDGYTIPGRDDGFRIVGKHLMNTPMDGMDTLNLYML